LTPHRSQAKSTPVRLLSVANQFVPAKFLAPKLKFKDRAEGREPQFGRRESWAVKMTNPKNAAKQKIKMIGS